MAQVISKSMSTTNSGSIWASNRSKWIWRKQIWDRVCPICTGGTYLMHSNVASPHAWLGLVGIEVEGVE